MSEEALNHSRVRDRGDQVHPPGAPRTTQDVQVEGPAHQQGPRPVAGRGCARGARPGIGRLVPFRASVGDDLWPPACMRGQHPVESTKLISGRGVTAFGGVAVDLASDASKYHTGDTFVIDGGYVIF